MKGPRYNAARPTSPFEASPARFVSSRRDSECEMDIDSVYILTHVSSSSRLVLGAQLLSSSRSLLCLI